MLTLARKKCHSQKQRKPKENEMSESGTANPRFALL